MVTNCFANATNRSKWICGGDEETPLLFGVQDFDDEKDGSSFCGPMDIVLRKVSVCDPVANLVGILIGYEMAEGVLLFIRVSHDRRLTRLRIQNSPPCCLATFGKVGGICKCPLPGLSGLRINAC
ncbi:hypothetical protein SAMN06266787_1301 [Halorubrum ezzemoulense]|uniref:Uncharacterized protein n=1 Tax=Halorubrum ezzemoulense TaxID=337243 RepID=A0A238Z6H3_HALEZ|nr:hypothetical protein SAMN06266787_1301 [Halorubrum ezzemoulense]